ncbi:MAG TPA: protein kinase [Candidatus Competibacter sp.]|nr:protein kinase [Candidatus Competibacter sp.]
MIDTAKPSIPSKGRTRRANALSSGCMLDEYRIDTILGAGGFGVTYKAWDTLLETWVAIKEYFPVEWSFRDADGVTVHSNTQGGDVGGNDERLSDYLWGLERFLDEARVLARVQHPFVVRVKRYFRAHGTAYIVMDYEDGEPLNAILQDGETLSEDEVRGLLEDVLPALQAVHEQGFLHRDIKPANLYVRASDRRVILIDFGAARAAVGRHSKSVTSLVTPGYSPPEQYTTRNDRYGTWTDVYALGAVLYRCVTGRPPTEAAERLLEDSLEPAARAGAGRYSASLLRVIDRALAVRPEQRFHTVAEMQGALNDAPEEDEDGDKTVILAPLARPTGKPTRPAHKPDVPRLIEPPVAAVVEQIADVGRPEIVPSPNASGKSADQRLDVLRSSPSTGTIRRPRPAAVLIGGAVAVAAVAIVWLWPSSPSPEEKPPPRYSFGQRETPAAASNAGPPLVAGASVSAVPSTVPVTVRESATPGTVSGLPSAIGEPTMPSPATVDGPPPPADESPAVETPEARSPVAIQPELSAQSAGKVDAGSESPAGSGNATAGSTLVPAPAPESAPEPAAGTGAGFLAPKAAPSAAAAYTGSPVAPVVAKPAANKPSIRPRPTRPQASKTRPRFQPSETRPVAPAGEKPVLERGIRNPWESPATTGFNQK